MPKEIVSDRELIQGFSAGDMAAFEELIGRYESKAYNLAMRLTRNAEDAEEVLQDVFVTVYRKISGFEGKAQFSSWLYRITVNASFMKLRKRRQEQAITNEKMITNVRQRHGSERSLSFAQSDYVAVNNEIRIALDSAVNKLPDDYRAVFVLRDIDGLSNKEVSDILQLSIPAVKSRLHRSRLMLRKKLKRFYEDYSTEAKIYALDARLMQEAA